MMRITKPLSAALVIVGLAMPAVAADFSDPTWPCIQRKVDRLSLGLMWPYEVENSDSKTAEDLPRDVTDLAETLALRRVELDSLRPRIETVAAAHDGDPQLLGQVFAHAFDSLSTRRTRIIKGIEKFSLGQIALAERIDEVRLEMETLLAAAEPDFDRIDRLEEQLDWDQVIYTDRQRSITYLCETPTLLERRLFSIAQMLQQVVRDQG